ncbi:MAG: HIRAN domain-containing protein [Promethearchaeota archaeon]
MIDYQNDDLKENQYYHLQIVGIYYTRNGEYLSELPSKTELELKPEPNNRYDRFAVSVWHNNKKLGYLPRKKNKPFFNALVSNQLILNCILGCYIPSSENLHYRGRFQPERANITVHTYRNEIAWRPVNLLPEDSMAF